MQKQTNVSLYEKHEKITVYGNIAKINAAIFAALCEYKKDVISYIYLVINAANIIFNILQIYLNLVI